jgi:3-oxoacyl-[acyl-carrier protein] reductase
MTAERDFGGAVALVTGGSRGIGAATVRRLASEGARVHFTWLQEEEAARRLETLPAAWPIRAHRLDVRDVDAVRDLVEKVVADAGPISLLVNNAGVTRDRLLGDMRDEDFDVVVETNLIGCFQITEAVARKMLPRRRGAIVNVSSVAGERPEAGQSNYAASKAGINALTRALALELGPRGIRINAVAPGITPTTAHTTSKNARLLARGLTGQIPLRRLGGVDEVASAITWLLSDEASYVSGAIVNVGGGYKL